MADALIRKGSGDAALLYLYLLRHDGYYEPAEAQKTLKWTQLRLEEALSHLEELGVKTGAPQPVFAPEVPSKEDAPEYTQKDLAQAISDKESSFPYVLEDVQRQLGKTLSDRETRLLLELYDHLAMPPEVILMLVQWQCEEYAQKHGEGRRPTMSAIRSAAYRWKKSGVETLEEAEAYLKKLDYYRSQEGKMLSAVGIHGRKALDSERKTLSQWLEWDFPPETVAMAYEMTIYNTGKFNWSYCTAILKRWHQAGLRTPKDIRAKDAPPRRSGGKVSHGPVPAQPLTAQQQRSQEQALEENQRELKRLLASVASGSEEES
jgi:DnaD/phage-associated family protein